MKKIIPLLLVLTCSNSFATSRAGFDYYETDSNTYSKIENLEEILNKAESAATISGKLILETARSMISNQEIVIGSCWDYIDAIFNRAGYFEDQRTTIFKSKLPGPYVSSERIKSGDWLYFINHSYGDVEHSGIFVAWTDRQKREALVISYAGGDQERPARYKKYDLSSVYNIIRPRVTDFNFGY